MVIITTLLGYLILVGFSFIEGRFRRGQEAKSFEAGQFDQRTTRFLGLAYFISVIALLASWLLNFYRDRRTPGLDRLAGNHSGLIWLIPAYLGQPCAGRVLHADIEGVENQVIVREGPYRLIRHPGYLGMILIWSGIAAATANWIVILIVFVVTISAYYYRIENEEKMLLSMHADYSEYRSHTWRLIPFIY